MKTITTEEMRFRQRVVKYAIKHDNNAKAEDLVSILINIHRRNWN